MGYQRFVCIDKLRIFLMLRTDTSGFRVGGAYFNEVDYRFQWAVLMGHELDFDEGMAVAPGEDSHEEGTRAASFGVYCSFVLYLASSILLGNSHWRTFCGMISYRVASYGTTSHGTTSGWIACYEFDSHRSISSGIDSLVKANIWWYNFLLKSQTMFSNLVQTQL